MNTQKISILVMTVFSSIIFSGCEYSNQFQGTLNGMGATLTAYSRNVNRYCIKLDLTQDQITQTLYISAPEVFDAQDPLKTKEFNSKKSDCNQMVNGGAKEYLIGTRSTQVFNTDIFGQSQTVGSNMCQTIYYNRYQYQENLNLEIHQMADDQLMGNFTGTGKINYYTDFNHPVDYGPIYYCGNGQGPYPIPGAGIRH